MSPFPPWKRRAVKNDDGPERMKPEVEHATAPDTDGDVSSASDTEIIEPHAERKLLLKLDAVFVPIIMLVYLSCFLDRTNIGNAKVARMPEDIGASPAEFSTAISIFYAT